MPVATIDTLIDPFIFVSIAAPKIILASGSISSLILCTTSSTSSSFISFPPVIFTRIDFAPFIEESSSSGFAIADSAASMARFFSSPEVTSPVPSCAFPISDITDFMSAKSRFIRLGLVIKSVTPLTPACKTSSTILNASEKPIFSLQTLNKF